MAFNPGGSGGSASIAGSNDVALNAPTNGQVLGYDSALSKWKNNPRSAQLVEIVNTVAAAGTSETIPDTTVATITNLKLSSASCVLTFPAAGAGKSFLLAVAQDATGGRMVTWPNTVKWQGGATPTLTVAAQKQDIFSFICIDGTNWLGFQVGQDF